MGHCGYVLHVVEREAAWLADGETAGLLEPVSVALDDLAVLACLGTLRTEATWRGLGGGRGRERVRERESRSERRERERERERGREAGESE